MGIALLSPQPSLAAGGGSGPISDFMTMDVCLRADGSVAAGVIPGSPECKSRRDIRPGEQPPYTLQNFSGPRAPCKGGSIIKVNIPVTKGQNTRITSSTIRTSCGSAGPEDTEDTNSNGVSIQWYDGGYGFIMGSYSPVALSSFESNLCAQNSQSSQRFFRGWVIAPAVVPSAGSTGFGVFPSKLYAGKPSDVPGACSPRYNKGLTSWAVKDFTYKSDRKLLSIISNHFSRSNDAGNGPGDAMQMEQTYWTREFGLSRWEKWAREEWVHPRSKLPAAELAHKMAAAGRCSRPALGATNFANGLQMSATSPDESAYSRVITDPQTGEKHTWYMTLCEDYTNAAPSGPNANYVAPMQKLADDIYWR
jgi:hypothetical protein